MCHFEGFPRNLSLVGPSCVKLHHPPLGLWIFLLRISGIGDIRGIRILSVMDLRNLHSLSASEAARLIHDGVISSVQLVEAYLARIREIKGRQQGAFTMSSNDRISGVEHRVRNRDRVVAGTDGGDEQPEDQGLAAAHIECLQVRIGGIAARVHVGAAVEGQPAVVRAGQRLLPPRPGPPP